MRDAPPHRSALLTPDEVAAELRVTTKTLRNWRYLGNGPTHVMVGGRARYRRVDVDAFLTH